MPLREHFESSGEWLFRWRSYLPFFVLIPLAAAIWTFEWPLGSHRLHAWWELVCVLVSFTGLGIRIYTVGHTPHRTSGRNTKHQIASSLNTTGIYSVVRHPLYLGNYLVWIGLAMFWLNAWLVVILSLAFWLYYERIMFAEEEFLRRSFGEDYVAWARSTPAFIPDFRLWKRPVLPFSLRNALKREYNGLFGIVAGFCIMEWVEHLVTEQQLLLDPLWTAFGLTGLMIYLVLRTLKRHTRLLHVEGR